MSDELKSALLELIRELRPLGLRILLGGGYGLYLKQLSLQGTQTRTFLPQESWPRPRATADLDVFLPVEIVVDHSNMSRVRQTLDGLGYKPVEAAKYLHFARPGELGDVRVELLTGPIEGEELEKVKVNGFRVRPRKAVELHAYLTSEAVDFELEPLQIPIEDAIILIPNIFAFLLMKLHAFRDRKDESHDDEGRQLGRHHALDVYRLVAMLTEQEEDFVRSRYEQRRKTVPVLTATRIVSEDFADETSIGALRILEHALAGKHVDIQRFIEQLHRLFGVEQTA
jgi:hypothetical protein